MKNYFETKNIRNQAENQARFEADKLRYDLFKHITTLNTGSILITGGLVKNIFNEPNYIYLLLLSFLFFFISIISSLWGMIIKTHQIQIAHPLSNKFVIFLAHFVSRICIPAFVLGFSFVGIFFVLNISTPSVPLVKDSIHIEKEKQESKGENSHESRLPKLPIIDIKNFKVEQDDCSKINNKNNNNKQKS